MCSGGRRGNVSRHSIGAVEATPDRFAFLDAEKPFVPRFVEQRPAKKPRKKPFPIERVEFCICAANAFALDGHTVLVYSPQKSQVEPLAREFRHMRDQGFLRT